MTPLSHDLPHDLPPSLHRDLPPSLPRAVLHDLFHDLIYPYISRTQNGQSHPNTKRAVPSEHNRAIPSEHKTGNPRWHESLVLPYVDMTLKGWIWYQGENDMGGVFGNSARSVGYSCMMVQLVKTWRQLWSSAGATDPLAPFGLVTLAPSGASSYHLLCAFTSHAQGSSGIVATMPSAWRDRA